MKTIKRAVAIVCVLISLIGVNAFAQSYKYRLTDSVEHLERLDIIRNAKEKWDMNSPITRRDMFEAIYIVKAGRGLYIGQVDKRRIIGDYNVEDILCDGEEYTLDVQRSLVKSVLKKEYAREFAGLQEDSYDYCLAYSLLNFGLMEDTNTWNYETNQWNERFDVRFDSNATYEEALVAIARLLERFPDSERVCYKQKDSSEENLYYAYAEKRGLINDKFDLTSIRISEEVLDDEITAYEFFHILERALYVTYANRDGDYTVRYGDRYIDRILGAYYSRKYNDEGGVTEAVFNDELYVDELYYFCEDIVD